MKKLLYLILVLVSFGISAQSNDASDYLNRGVSKYFLDDYSGAIADYTKAIEIDPNYTSAYYSRGFSKYYLDDRFGACKDGRKAQELGYDASELIKYACN
jgi:tetratricopeptide (TPR) repeat protein